LILNSLICASFGLMISGACELVADEKYRIAAAHYEKANQIAREEGSDASKVRSLKKAHAEMQEIVWQYPETQAAKRVLVDTRISFSAADVEQKLSVLGVKANIEQLQPVNSMQENSRQSLAEYAIASLSGVYEQFDNRITGLLPRLDTKPNTAGTVTVEQEPNNSTDLIQKNITSIEDDRVGTRTASGLATVALDKEEKNKVSDITTSEAPLTVTMLPTKLPNKKPDNYHLFTKQKPKAEPVQSVISPIGSIDGASSSASAMQSLTEDAITAVASAPDENAAEQIEPEKIASSKSNSGSAMETQGRSNDQSAQLPSDKNNEPDIADENIASSDSSQESELLDLADNPKKSDGIDDVKVNVNLSKFYGPFLRFSILQSVSDNVDDWFDDSASETLQNIDKSEITRMSGYSIAAGWRYKNYGLAYVYENHGERTKKDTGITSSTGSTDFTEDKFKTTIQLIELSKTWSLSKQVSVEIFGALGEARREYILSKGLDSSGAWEVPGSIRTREPAWRIGVGQNYKLSGPLSIYGRLYYSDYGRVALGGNPTNSGEEGFEHKSTEASIGLEYKL
jgi:ribosomal 50S subunit-recycling heat shock protein